MTIGRVKFIAPETGDVIDSFVYDSILDHDQTMTAREFASRVLGIDTDPIALLVKLEADPKFRAAVMDLDATVPLFAGLHSGRLDAIASERITRVQDMCRSVEARLAAEAAFKECT